MKSWKERIIRFAIKNRKSPMENRRLVGEEFELIWLSFYLLFFWLILR